MKIKSQFKPTKPPRVTGVSWAVCLHFVFNQLNSQNGYYLFKRWMLLTQEMPPSCYRDYKVLGLSREKNDQYWRTVDWYNRIYYYSFNSFVFVFSLVVSGLLFMVPYEGVGLWFYLAIQAFHTVHTILYVLFFYHAICSVSMLFISVMGIFIKKFKHIASRTAELNAMNAPRNNKFNRKLFKLIFEHNRVHLELMEMNAFFSKFVAVNLVHLFW